MDRYKEVWNHPLIGYTSVVTHEGGKGVNSAPGTTRTIRVKTLLSYIHQSKNDWNTIPRKEEHLLVKYTLDLNSQGQIIGGSWRSIERPDFLWIKEKAKTFLPGYQRLKELLND